ncbi:MAG TPA: ThiF family adenylyltransferase [Roseiflexaceae bacterium]|nr:ThiF family adenylyltransferase [Roseiflexaceae bacterium]
MTPSLTIEAPIPFTLPSTYAITVCVVGCGGTGGYAMPHIAQIAYHCRELGLPPVRIILVDGDEVERRNVLRQNFLPGDVGRNKARVLAHRFSAGFGLTIEAIPEMATPELLVHLGQRQITREEIGILVGCVDNATARRAMATALANRDAHWTLWLDAGNDVETGQVVVGTTTDAKKLRGALALGGLCTSLPAVSLIYPDILTDPAKKRPAATGDDCAAAVEDNRQALMINKDVAIVVGQYLYELAVDRRLTTFWTSTSLHTHSRSARPITASALASATGLAPETLTATGPETKPAPKKQGGRKKKAAA